MKSHSVSYRDAMLSDCRRYRYTLTRIWRASLPVLAVVGLNPSTADEHEDDPTIRRCIGFAKKWEFGGIIMLNLFAFRATDPRDLLAEKHPGGDRNDAILAEETCGRLTLCAWGSRGTHMHRSAEVAWMLRERQLVHLGLTKGGEPRHPLYLRATEAPRSWKREPGE